MEDAFTIGRRGGEIPIDEETGAPLAGTWDRKTGRDSGQVIGTLVSDWQTNSDRWIDIATWISISG